MKPPIRRSQCEVAGRGKQYQRFYGLFLLLMAQQYFSLAFQNSRSYHGQISRRVMVTNLETTDEQDPAHRSFRKRWGRKRHRKGKEERVAVPHSGRHFAPSHPQYRPSFLRRIFRQRKRFMEGWYYRLTLKDYRVDGEKNPSKAASFAFIISIEDPGIQSSNLRLACLQAIGPNDNYLVQATTDDTAFWAHASDQSLGCTFESDDDRPGKLPHTEWKDTIQSGFQITSGSVERNEWPRWLGRIQGHDGTGGGVLDGQGVSGDLEFDFEVDPNSVSGYGGYTTTLSHSNNTKGGIRRGNRIQSQRQKSTGGWLSNYPIFEPHWQVTISDALASGRIDWNGTMYTFENQPFYAEKNWGDALPSKWYWTQCNSFDNVDGELSVTAGGGIRKLPFGKEEELGMIAIHHKGRFYEAVPWKGNVEWNVTTWGEWTLYGDRLEETSNYDSNCKKPSSKTPPFAVEIKYRCDPQRCPGLVFRAPTPKRGMVPFCRDTFEADCELTLWELEWNEAKKTYEKMEPPILDRVTSREGGAEIGGGPWWETWKGKSKLKPVIKTLLNIPSRLFPHKL